MSLDYYDMIPPAQRAYLANNGWHFSKAAYEFAVKQMKNKDGKITPYTKSQVEEVLKLHQITLKDDLGYDAAYVATMCKSDYFGSSIVDEKHLALYIKDTLDDEDAGEGSVMRCWYAKMVSKGVPVPWEELL